MNLPLNDTSSDDNSNSSDDSDQEGAAGGAIPSSLPSHKPSPAIALPKGLLDNSQDTAPQSETPRKVTIRRTGSLREECLASTQRRVEETGVGVYRVGAGAEGYSPKLEAGKQRR